MWDKRDDPTIRNQIVMDNIGLVWSVVHRMRNSFYTAEDLFQVGSIGLMKAVDRFKPEYGFKFATYAIPLIWGEIQRYKKEYNYAVRIPRYVHDAIARGEDVHINGTVSIDSIVNWHHNLTGDAVDDHRFTHTSIIGDTSDYGYSELLMVIDVLPARLKRLVTLYYVDDLEQREIASILGVSQAQVSRSLTKAIELLRKELTA